MENFIFLNKKEFNRLPKSSGVYAFRNNQLLYIGKAADIRKRVKNHFQRPSYQDNLFINKVEKIGYIETDSEIEALILEANLIKKYQPKFNILWKDDKNYFYVAITKEKCPRVFITHQPELQMANRKLQIDYIGPFVEGNSLKKTLRELRKIFPFYSGAKHPAGLCPWCHLELCPGPNPDLKEYEKNIKNLTDFFRGMKNSVLKNLEKEMKETARDQNFEKASEIRDKIFSLNKILAHAKIGQPESSEKWTTARNMLAKIAGANKIISRIEAYDISDIQGRQATGSMVVFSKGAPDKNSYRKFKIKTIFQPNDVAMIKEILKRRFSHPEWRYPDAILIDGGKGQLNAAIEIKNQNPQTADIPVLALAKKENELYIEGKESPILLEKLPKEISNLILRLRDEAHRFAKAYHHKLREIDLLAK